MRSRVYVQAALVVLVVGRWAGADLIRGPLADFQDPSQRTQNWAGGASPTRVPDGGPLGSGDAFLRIGMTGNFATRNGSPPYSGTIAADVFAIQADMMRPATDPASLEMRMVLFGQGVTEAWTTTASVVVPNDGVWRNYSFSILEQDMTQVTGMGAFSEVTNNLTQVMFRYDPGPPTAGGSAAPGTLGIDNIRAVPEPGTPLLLLLASASLLGTRRRLARRRHAP